MARKPRTELKDVFARPGQAPERNTAIEDLPRSATPDESPAAAPPEPSPAAGTDAVSPPPAAAELAAPPPVPAEPPAPVVAEPVVAEPVVAEPVVAGPVAGEPVAAQPASPPPAAAAPVSPEPVSPEPVSPEPVSTGPASPGQAEPLSAPRTELVTAPPPRRVPPPPRLPVQPATSPSTARAVTLLAGFAVLVALTAPFFENWLLGLVGTTTPAARAQQEAALTLSRQEQKLRDLEQRLAAAQAQLAATRDDLQQSTQRRTDHTTWGAWGRLLSLGRVADALRGSTPFASDLAVARTVGAGIDEFGPDLDKLAAYAGTGVPTRADIDREFRRVADDTLRPGRGILPSGLVRRLDTLNPWTPSTPATPADPAPDLVQAAAARLAEGDVEEAIARIRQMNGTYQGAFSGWLEDAQARVTADALVRRIDRTLAQLARELPK